MFAKWLSASEARARRQLIWTVGALGTIFVGVAVIQSYFLAEQTDVSNLNGPLIARLSAGLIPTWTGGFFLAALGAHRLRKVSRGLPLFAGVAVLISLMRIGLQSAFKVYEHVDSEIFGLEFVAGSAIAFLCCLLATMRVISERRELEGNVAMLKAHSQVVIAVEALQTEEVRVQRAVAEGLHGSLQHRMVLLNSRLTDVIAALERDEAYPLETADLIAVRDDFDDIRERSIRALSRLLSPEGLEIGLVPAIRLLLGRLPASVAWNLTASDSVRRLDDPVKSVLPIGDRFVIVRCVEEAVTNALRHGGAGRIDVSLELQERPGRTAVVPHDVIRSSDQHIDVSPHTKLLRVEIRDDGRGFNQEEVEPSGLESLSQRLELNGGTLSMWSKVGQGTVMTALMPVVVEEFEIADISASPTG